MKGRMKRALEDRKETEPPQSNRRYTEGDCRACHLRSWSGLDSVLKSSVGSMPQREGEN